MNIESLNVYNFKINWLETFVGGYENNPKFNQLYLYYFMDIGDDNLTEAENYINAIKNEYISYDGDWKLPERQLFYYSYANINIKNTIDALLASFLPNFSGQVFSYSTMLNALQNLAIVGRPIFCFFLTVSDANSAELKTFMDESYISSMLGQVAISTTMNDKLGYTGELLIEYIEGVDFFAITYQILINRNNTSLVIDKSQKYLFNIIFV